MNAKYPNIKPLSKKEAAFIASLKTKKGRRATNSFLAEGFKLCEESLIYGSPTLLAVADSALEKAGSLIEKFAQRKINVRVCDDGTFRRISDEKTPQGVLAANSIPRPNADFNSPFVILNGASDPGNVGTIMRTMDWFGFSNLVLDFESADPFSPKTVRASMGAVFRIDAIRAKNLRSFLSEKLRDFRVAGAFLSGEPLEKFAPKNDKFALVFGSEAKGIDAEILDAIDERYFIEGKGETESLNLAVAAGIFLHRAAKFSPSKTRR